MDIFLSYLDAESKFKFWELMTYMNKLHQWNQSDFKVWLEYNNKYNTVLTENEFQDLINVINCTSVKMLDMLIISVDCYW